MFSLYVECRQEEKDLLIAELWERRPEGIEECDLADGRCGLRAFFNDRADEASLAREFTRYGARWQQEEERDWVEEARRRLAPLCVGARFFLVPAWRNDPTPPGRFRIRVNPGMAYGTGAHASTQLCLEALERELRPGMVVLDVGTGSGILATAATMLGGGCVMACDIDPVAVQVACQKLSFTGSADAVRSASVDFIVANISSEAIIGLAGELARCLRPGGVIIAGGFEISETSEVKAALEARGAVTRETRSKDGWSALVASV